MSKQNKIWLIIGASLLFLGLIMFSLVMMVNNWNFTKLSTVEYETNTYEVSNRFNGISIKTKTADIVFESSDDGECKVVCYEEEKVKHSVSVQDETLIINVIDDRKWYDYFGITLSSPKITVYLPDAYYDTLLIKGDTGDIEIPNNFKFESIDISSSTGSVNNEASASQFIKIKMTTGNIFIENISTGIMELSVSTGKITAKAITCGGNVKVNVSTGDAWLTDISCKALVSTGSTGDVWLKKVIASEQFNIKRSTGNIIFEKCDAYELFIKTDTGYVKGSLLSNKVFIAESDTGSVDVPKTIIGGKCEITTNTGDINVAIEE